MILIRQMKHLWSNVNPKIVAEYISGAAELESCECACEGEVGTVSVISVRVKVTVSMFGLLQVLL